MDRIAPAQLKQSVRDQANFRITCGIPVALTMLAVITFFGPEKTHAGVAPGLVLAVVYVAYALAARFVSGNPRVLSARDVVLISAVVDPIFLSAWLYLAGEGAIIFVGLYIFTILGFGFRIGTVSMFVCQSVSILGFVAVVMAQSSWEHEALFAISHIVLMVMVPLYAASLIRRLQSAKAHAEHESKAKSQLLANVSHELRTPLTGIVSSAQLIESESNDPQAADRAQAILQLATALNGEINQLLDLAKLESQRTQSGPIPFNLTSATDHVMRALSPVASTKGISLEVQVDPRLTQRVLGCAQDLISVLMNLAGNAVKFTSKGGVTLTVVLVEETGSSYRLRFGVQDTGIGIPSEHLAKIFEPFFQVESGTKRIYGGTGLGTTIASEHVRNMGGLLHVESKVGEGTLFWFEVDMDQEAEAAKPVEPRPTPRTITGKRILVADDNDLNLELVRQMLLKDSHSVTVAHNGEEAINCLAHESFDLVFLDFNMGDIDGATVYQAYSFGKLKTAPTFFLTADTTKLTTNKLEALGASGVIYKPLTFDNLRNAIGSQFPYEAARQSPDPTQKAARLRAVPIEFLDPEAIENLRDIKDTPEFLYKMLGDGIDDLLKMEVQLSSSLVQSNVSLVHREAHAIRGVALSFGAVRLAALAHRLMTINAGALEMEKSELVADLKETSKLSVAALQQLRHGYQLKEAANYG